MSEGYATKTIQEQCYGTCWEACNQIDELRAQLDAVTKERDEWKQIQMDTDNMCCKLTTLNETLTKERDALAKDKQMVDWLYHNTESVMCMEDGDGDFYWVVVCDSGSYEAKSPREAIDAAMKGDK